MYIGRPEAVRTYAPDDPDVDEHHVFQGDIFEPWLQLATPMLGGAVDPQVCAAIVISHHCEYTKAKTRPDYPMLVAPLDELDSYPSGQRGQIQGNWFRYLLYFPAEGSVDREYVADLRRIQPIAGADLASAEDHYLASCGPQLHRLLQAKVIEFILRDETLDCDETPG